MSVTLEWNNKGLQKIFYELSPKQQAVFHTKAMRNTANQIAKMVKSSAAGQGLASTGRMEKNGWKWTRYGRVANSVKAGKLWSKGTRQTVRVFNTGGKRVGFMKSAPHAHLVILGHQRFIPQRDGTMLSRGKTKGVPIYQAAYSNADVLFERNIEKSVAAMIRKINKL